MVPRYDFASDIPGRRCGQDSLIVVFQTSNGNSDGQSNFIPGCDSQVGPLASGSLYSFMKTLAPGAHSDINVQGAF